MENDHARNLAFDIIHGEDWVISQGSSALMDEIAQALREARADAERDRDAIQEGHQAYRTAVETQLSALAEELELCEKYGRTKEDVGLINSLAAENMRLREALGRLRGISSEGNWVGQLVAKALSTPPTAAAERVRGLVEALERIDRADTTSIGFIAYKVLAAYQGAESTGGKDVK